MPALQGQDKVENPVAIPDHRCFSIILGLHGCKAGLTDLGASASSLETDGIRGKSFRPLGTRPETGSYLLRASDRWAVLMQAAEC